MKPIKELRILISGGTSGLGRALTLELSGRGAKVATFARGREGVLRLRTEAPQAMVFEADVADQNQSHFIAAQTYAALGGVDVLIHNASTLGPRSLKLLADTECEELSSALETNLVGPFRLSKLIVPSMIAQGHGLLVHISTDAAVSAYAKWGAYSASKAAADHLSRLWNVELGDFGVRSVAIDPGDMRTALHLQAIPGADLSALKDPAVSAREIVAWLESGADSGERMRL